AVDDAGGRRPDRPAARHAQADRRGAGGDGAGQLLDGTAEPASRAVAGGLAAGGAEPGGGADLRAVERGGVRDHRPAAAAGGGGGGGGRGVRVWGPQTCTRWRRGREEQGTGKEKTRASGVRCSCVFFSCVFFAPR